MKLFRQAYEQDNGLPVGFTEVEYLESTETQYIDTGVELQNDLGLKAKITNLNSRETIWGAGPSGSGRFSYIRMVGSVLSYSNTNTTSWQNYGTVSVGTPFEIEENYNNDKTAKLNGEIKQSNIETSKETSGWYVYLFGRNHPINSVSYIGYARLYYCKITVGNTLVRDFIPCIDPLGVPCMYDLVSKKAYYNQGTGEDFIVGRHIIPVEYLESKGTQYIDTGLRLTQNNAIEVCYKINSVSGFSGIIGARSSANSNNISVNANTGGSGSPFISVDFNNSNFETYRARYDDRTNDKILAYLDKHIRKISINNSAVVSNNTECNDTITTQSNCLLFRTPGINGYCDLNMYYCKIYDNDILVRDYIPAIDENNVGYMFDRVTHTAYLNAGSGNFTYGEDATKYKTRLGFVRQMGGALRRLPKGFTEVEYLESTGTQWIDIGYIPTNSTGYKLKHTICEDNSIDNIIIGCRENSGATRFWEDIDWGSSDTLGWGYGNYSANTLIYRWSLVEKAGNVVESGCNYYNSRNCFVNDEIKQLPQPELPKITRPMYLFCANNAGSASYFIKSKIYYVKITEGSTLVRYFIPCIDQSGTPCMYDIVEGKAYYNKGTGTFLYGEKKPARYLAIPKVRLEVPAIYKKLNYLESTGTQYINTGIVGTNENMGIDVDWAFSNNNTNMCIFSSRSGQTSFTFTLFWLKTVSNRMRFDGVNQQYFTEGVNASASDDIFNFNYKSKTGAVATLTNKTTGQAQTYTIGKLETFSTNPLYLFCSRDTAEVYSWIKMYGCKIYDGDTVVRDFIPVLRKSDNKPGMYDKVNQIFYVNGASGVDFNYG